MTWSSLFLESAALVAVVSWSTDSSTLKWPEHLRLEEVVTHELFK